MKKMISRRNFLKVCAVAGSAVALSACGGSKKPAAPDPSNTDQTSFDIVGGQSALSPGYNDNEVLKKLADNVGVKLNYETMSGSLSEQVNIRIAGDQLPDAFMGVGFSNSRLLTLCWKPSAQPERQSVLPGTTTPPNW